MFEDLTIKEFSNMLDKSAKAIKINTYEDSDEYGAYKIVDEVVINKYILQDFIKKYVNKNISYIDNNVKITIT